MHKRSDDTITMKALKNILLTTVSDRDWEDNCYPVNLAKSIAISSNNLLEMFRWADSVESWEAIINPKSKKRIERMLMKIFFQIVVFAEISEIDMTRCIVKSRKGTSLQEAKII